MVGGRVKLQVFLGGHGSVRFYLEAWIYMFVNPGLWYHCCAKKKKNMNRVHFKSLENPENPVSSHHPQCCLRLCCFSFPGCWIEHAPLWAFTRLQANHSICVTKWHTLQTLTLISPHLVLLKVPNHFRLFIFPATTVPCTTVLKMLANVSWPIPLAQLPLGYNS